jgi:hypothetical protein
MFPFLLLAAGAGALYFYGKYRNAEYQQASSSFITSIESAASEVGQAVSTEVKKIPFVGQLFVSQAIIQKIAAAIAFAEGGYNLDGSNKNDYSRPSRNHNPGDLKGNFAGTAIGQDPQGFDVYANDSDGWNALYRQVTLWLTNRSAVAGSGSTIAELGVRYTTTQQAGWINNVSSALGVSPDTTLGEIA